MKKLPRDKDNGDYYFSVTIPSLIVATFGDGAVRRIVAGGCDRVRPVGV